MPTRPAVVVLLLVQGLCAIYFVGDIVLTLLGITYTPIEWRTREMIEIAAAIGLSTGTVLGALVLRQSLARTRRAEAALRAASGAFMDLLQERFGEWDLTPAERDVALFSVKGLSTSEIARVRETSEGTVKAQCAAIYRKAGVSGRAQLLSVFIEDLFDENALVR
jgi:DNA-binding CsgD family transcriptional regulator